MLAAWGAEFLLVAADRGSKGVDWPEVLRQAGAKTNCILLPDGASPPEDLELSQPVFPGFDRLVLRNTACALIERSKMPMYRRVLGLYDPNGQHADYLEKLLKYYTSVHVVTEELSLYEQAAQDMMARLGAPVLVSDACSILDECVLILAPEPFAPPKTYTVPCPVMGTVLETRPRFDVFDALEVLPCGADAGSIPPGIPGHLFAAALHEHYGLELSGLVAGELKYNHKRATLAEAVYAVLRNAGYPSGL